MESNIPETTGPAIRMVLVGKTGVGKSAAGNTILSRKAFQSSLCSTSVTSVCRKELGTCGNFSLAVVDTPGLFDTTNQEAILQEVAKCISFSAPGPHVFLVTIQPNRFTEEEQNTIKLIQKLFGEKAVCYTIVLFTHGDDLNEEEVSIEDFIERSSPLSDFVNQCGRRYHVFDNRKKGKEQKQQVSELLDKISKMVYENKQSYYTNEMLEEAERAIKEEAERIRQENPDINPNDARKQAEMDNKFTRNAVNAGAQTGAMYGAIFGPVGMAVGAAVGALVGHTKKDACVIQ